MTQPTLHAAADYADALLAARRGKNVLFTLLLLAILLQLALFLLARFTTILTLHGDPHSTAAATRAALLRYLLGMTDFIGLVAPILLGIVLLFIVNTLLAGRLLGAGRLTSAFMWTMLLALLLFPWQALFNNPASAADPTLGILGVTVPGSLYTYAEFVDPRIGAAFPMTQQAVGTDNPITYASFVTLRWARFVGFPIVSLLILLSIQIRSNRGLRQALGGGAPDVTLDPLLPNHPGSTL
jgi:hypothetical protein